MSAEEVAAHIERVDKKLNSRGQVTDEEKNVNLSPLYARYGWGGGASPLPDEALKKLKLEDKSGDPRWMKHFLGNRVHIGVYRSRVGFYWLLRYDGAMMQIWLEHVGSAFDVEGRFTKKG